MTLRYLIPLTCFVLLTGFLGLQLGREATPLPSALIDRPTPSFQAVQLASTGAGATFTPKDMRGQVWLLNVWASWCTTCRAEHPLLMDISKQGLVPIVGLNYEDEARHGKAWLAGQGNPYVKVPADQDGRIGMDLGVYGVPETFVIDKQGRIRLRHAGPLTQEVWKNSVLPLIEALQGG